MNTTAHAHPNHHADLETCLELVNTLAYDDETVTDDLSSPEAAVGFLADHGLAHREALQAQAERDPAWLADVVAARDAMRDLWDAEVEGRSAAAGTVDRLNAILAHAPRAALVPAIAGVSVGHRHVDEDPTAEALARAIQPMLDAIAAGETARFRVCANDGCRWVFEDTSRGGHRRWCSMSSCGNRAKAKRFRSRKRAGDDPAAAVGETPGADEAPAG